MLIRSTLLAIATVAGLTATSITVNASQSVSPRWLEEQRLKKEQKEQKQRREEMLEARHRNDLRRHAAAARQRQALEADLERERERNRALEGNLLRQREQAVLQREQNLKRQAVYLRAREYKAACDSGDERACIRLDVLRAEMRPYPSQ